MNALEILRDPVAVFFTLLFPLAFLFAFGYGTSSGGPPRLRVAIVNNAAGFGEAFARRLSAYNLTRQQRASAASAQKLLKAGSVDAIIILSTPRPVPLAVSATSSAVAGPLMAPLVQAAARGFEVAQFQTAHKVVTSLSVEKQASFNYFDFVLPGIVALSILQVSISATALPLLRARDSGALLHLSLLPIARSSIVVAQALPRLGISVVAVLAILIPADLVFHANFPWIETLALSILSSASMIAVGYALAGWSSHSLGTAMITTLNFGMMICGSIFFPSSSLSALAIIGALLPLSPISDALRYVMTGANNAWPLWLDLSAIVFWLIVGGTIAATAFRYEANKR